MAETDPRTHTANMERALHDMRQHLRNDVKLITEPRAKALFETAAEVLGGLEKAFRDYDKKDEPAWR